VFDVFQPEQQRAFDATGLRIEDQPAHFVTLLKVLDESVAAQAPSIAAKVPAAGKMGEDLGFTAAASEDHVPALGYHWDFGDGVIADGATLTHTYTREGSYKVHLSVEGVDGLSFEEDYPVSIKGAVPLPTPKRGPVNNEKM
jgi:hypothetical protein